MLLCGSDQQKKKKNVHIFHANYRLLMKHANYEDK